MNDTPNESLLSQGGVWTLADILQHGRDTATCPYFTIRRSVCSRFLFFHNEELICGSRCHSSTSLFTLSITFWTRRWPSKFRRRCLKTQLLYLTRRITLVRGESATRRSYLKVTTDLDNVCIESLSIDLTRPMLDAAARSVDKLADKIDEQVPSEFLGCG